ncbi:MAG: sulfurtransferase-like selenium metabolism protein YedF [Desulfobacterales bacterium]
MKEIDAKGLSCPAPVIQTKAIIEEYHPDVIKIMVDNEAARQNVSRYLASQNYAVSVEKSDNDFNIIGKRSDKNASDRSVREVKESGHIKIMFMISTDKIGHGDDELGTKLMDSFLKTLKEIGPDLWKIIFVNNGVKLTVENSTMLLDLKNLADSGTDILVCGTCLNHFNLLEKKQIGETTNMLDIITSMQLADKVINL